MTTRRVLITGSSGFVGSHLARRFRERGWHVCGIGRRPLDDPSYVRHDLSQPLPGIIGRFDVVIHAAARSNPWGARSDFLRDNVDATRNVLKYCRSIGYPKLIFISSSSVYYRPMHQFRITEETPMPKWCINWYAQSKKGAEWFVKRYRGRWTILRPRAVYGPGDTVLLPRILHAARRGRLPVLTTSGDPVIGDLIYIDNLVDAVESSVINDDAVGDFNLTNDAPVPILEFLFDVFDRLEIPRPTRRVSAASAMAVAGGLELFHRLFKPSVEPAITRFGVHVFRYSKTFDVSKAKRILGPPRIGNEESVQRTVEWFRQHPVDDSTS